MSADAADMAFDVAQLPETQKTFFRLGMARKLRDRIERMGDTHNVNKLFQNESMRQKLRAAFPDLKSYRNFLKVVMAETRKGETRSVVRGGSQTAQRLADQADAAPDLTDAAIDVATGNPTQGVAKAFNAIRQPRPALGYQESDMLSRMLFATSPREQQAVLQMLRAQPNTVQRLPGMLAPYAGISGGLLTQ